MYILSTHCTKINSLIPRSSCAHASGSMRGSGNETTAQKVIVRRSSCAHASGSMRGSRTAQKVFNHPKQSSESVQKRSLMNAASAVSACTSKLHFCILSQPRPNITHNLHKDQHFRLSVYRQNFLRLVFIGLMATTCRLRLTA